MRKLTSRVVPRIGLVFLLAHTAACQAVLGEMTSDDGVGQGVAGQVDLPAATTRFRRLTHKEWENTVRDLFGWDEHTGLSEDFRADPRQGGFLFDNKADSLKVDQSLWSAYQRAASEIALRASSDGEFLDRQIPMVGSDAEKAGAFITGFGELVHRRPLKAEQAAAYQAVYQAGTNAYDDTPGFQGGLRLVIEAMLQSPYFLYRVEESDSKNESGRILLDGYERAQRLSYLIWGSLPDERLFQLASEDALKDPESVRAEAMRMVEDPRADELIRTYFDGVLDTQRYARISPDPDTYPNAPANLSELALLETHQFVTEIVFRGDGGFHDLLTSRSTLVGPELGPLYGVMSPNSGVSLVNLPENERAGILTQIGFLAAHATSRDPDPIHRGVFVAKQLACLNPKAPPDAVPPLPEPGNKSNRQLVAEHTEAPGTSCRNCHSTIINPLGFPFENYDAVGAYRTMDRGHPVDASSTVNLSGSDDSGTSVQNAVDLALLLADSQEVHECLVGHFLELLHGREQVPEDEYIVKNLGQRSLKENLSLKELLAEFAVSRSFLERTAESNGGEP